MEKSPSYKSYDLNNTTPDGLPASQPESMFHLTVVGLIMMGTLYFGMGLIVGWFIWG